MKSFSLCIAILLVGSAIAQNAPEVRLQSDKGKIAITVGDAPLATYFYEDAKTTRPYFAHVHGPGGIRLTRNHPPIAKTDATDHAELHPGIWLAFGDLSGADNWRNRARVQHEKFVEEPKSGAGKGTFAVASRFLANDGKKIICRESCRYTFLVRPNGYLILWDSTFRSDDADFSFGDQEEMGLGVRIVSPLAVVKGGQILTSDGFKNEKQVRGKQSTWCDYSGVIDGRRVGITLIPHPKNFRPCWYHARDYGFVAANPFGRNALTGGAKSQIVVKQGETFRLRFGVLLHAAPTAKAVDLGEAYKDYLKHSADD